MPSEPLTLGFDTSAAHCAAALVSGQRVLAFACEEMARGQAERLMGVLEEVLAEAGTSWQDLSRIGVGVGPGNFTGIRIAVSAARGLALGLGVPAIGVTSFEAISLDAQGVPAVPAPRGQAYLQPVGKDAYLASEDVVLGLAEVGALATANAQTIAIQIAKIASACTDPRQQPAPKPLYIKPADAAPPREASPQILDA